MKQFLVVMVAVVFGVVLWRIGERMSADAIGLAVGVVFGVLAGLPAAVLVLVSAHRREGAPPSSQSMHPQNGYGNQPPVIVLTSGQPTPQALPQQQSNTPAGWRTHQSEQRQFRWVGVPENANED